MATSTMNYNSWVESASLVDEKSPTVSVYKCCDKTFDFVYIYLIVSV